MEVLILIVVGVIYVAYKNYMCIVERKRNEELNIGHEEAKPKRRTVSPLVYNPIGALPDVNLNFNLTGYFDVTKVYYDGDIVRFGTNDYVWYNGRWYEISGNLNVL